MSSDPLFVLAALAGSIVVAERAARLPYLHHLGSALLVIVVTAALANAGLIPTYSDEIPIYAGVFGYVGPVAIFLLLLRVNVRGLLQAGLPMVSLFLLGSLGTMIGVVAAMWLVGGSRAFGELYYALGGMYAGTYIGGGINFNAIALEYGVVKNGPLYAGAATVDNAMTTLWMAVTVVVPRILGRGRTAAAPEAAPAVALPLPEEREAVEPLELALLLGMAAAAVWSSELASRAIATATGVAVPSILLLTTLALVLAQLPSVQALRGARLLGWLAVLFFLAVIGTLCDFASLGQIGALGRDLIVLVVVAVAVHGLVLFGVAALLRIDPNMTAIASQANIGGATSALALARSLERPDLALPAVLIGALGNAIGTYLGFLIAVVLRSLPGV
jgi:uncharacterized membrane protein